MHTGSFARSMMVAFALWLGACAGEEAASQGNAGSGAETPGGAAGTSSTTGSGGPGAAGVMASDAGSWSAAGSGGAGGAGTAGTGGSPDLAALGDLSSCGAVKDSFTKNAIKPPAGGSGIYNAASEAQKLALGAAIRALVSGDVSSALAQAELAAYEICRGDDDGTLLVVLRPKTAGEGHALVAWRPQGTKPLIVEAPHAFHDADTEDEARDMFLATAARALIVSGTYRCANIAAGPCDGVTSACTVVPIPYTLSDAAHNSEMLFQVAHVALAESFPSDAVVSLHGMPDAGVSLSNGTQMSPAAGSFHARLYAELTAAFPSEQITSCQALEGVAANKRWCGSENVQGRHVNGSANVCASDASVTSNRFVHIEQSRAVRDNYTQVIAAFAKALE